MNSTETSDQSDDQVTNVFFGASGNGWILVSAFVVVAAYLTTFTGCLNRLERITLGSAYHLMLQRYFFVLMTLNFA